MNNFLTNLSNFIDTIADFFVDEYNHFIDLYYSLKDSLTFVYQCIGYLPGVVSSVASILIVIMIAKFVLSLGKQ